MIFAIIPAVLRVFKTDLKSPDLIKFDIDGPIMGGADPVIWSMLVTSASNLSKHGFRESDRRVENSLNRPSGCCQDSIQQTTDKQRCCVKFLPWLGRYADLFDILVNPQNFS